MSSATSHTVYVDGKPVTAKATHDGRVFLRVGSDGAAGSAVIEFGEDDGNAIRRVIEAAIEDAQVESTRPAPPPKPKPVARVVQGPNPGAVLDDYLRRLMASPGYYAPARRTLFGVPLV